MTRSSGRTGSRPKPHPLLSTRGCRASAWALPAANITTGIADHESGSGVPPATRRRVHPGRRQCVDQSGHSGLQALQRGLPRQVRRQGRQTLRSDLVVLARAPRLDGRGKDVEVGSVPGQAAHDLAQQPVLSGDGDRVVYRYVSDRPDVLEQAETLVFVDFLGIRLPVFGARRKRGVQFDVRSRVHVRFLPSVGGRGQDGRSGSSCRNEAWTRRRLSSSRWAPPFGASAQD